MTSLHSHYEVQRGPYTITTDPSRLDTCAIHAYITQSYWARGRSFDAVQRSIQHSLCFGLYHVDTQVGFARVITDCTVFAYLCDVFVLPQHSAQGLGTWLVAAVLAHPELQTVRRWMLSTSDAHEFYAVHGFTALARPDVMMELVRTPSP